jgi:pimeloyl-ACP methyl ester carboxylesterase
MQTAPIVRMLSYRGNVYDALLYKSVSPSSKHIIIIPGNPGVVNFYLEFASTIFEGFRKLCSVHVVGHGGHGRAGGKHTNVSDNIALKLAYMEDLIERDNNTELVIIGHSLGSYMAVNLLRNISARHVQSVVCLFPCMKDFKGSEGPFLKLLRQPGLRHVAAGFVHTVSSVPWLRSAITNQKDMHDDHRQTLHTMLNFQSIHNILALADDESRHIVDFDWEIMRQNAAKILFYFGEKDKWAPHHHYLELQAAFPEQTHLDADGIPHAFVLGHSKAMGEKVVEFIRTGIENDGTFDQDEEEKVEVVGEQLPARPRRVRNHDNATSEGSPISAQEELFIASGVKEKEKEKEKERKKKKKKRTGVSIETSHGLGIRSPRNPRKTAQAGKKHRSRR